MNKYSNIIRSLSRQNNCPLIELRKMFLDHLRINNPENKDRGILTTDGIHLNAAGNTFVAQAMLPVLAINSIK